MSQNAIQLPYARVPVNETAAPARSFVGHAKVISLLTLVSRVLGVLRESFAAKYFGAGLVSVAFTFAFTIPNLFRRLFGEGALSAAFIPLYAQSLKEKSGEEANRFAAASVNMLIVILLALTIFGELLLLAIAKLWTLAPDRLLAAKLTAIMLPYVLLVCGAAFLSAILQVHRRFALTAALPIILNVALIGGTIWGARIWIVKAMPEQVVAAQVRAVYFVSAFVLIAGVIQVLAILPQLRAVGFRFQWTTFWTPAVQKMVRLSIPVAIGAGVLQLSVLIDRGISLVLAQSVDEHEKLITHFTLFGHSFRYPMQFGAAARLGWAQYLYQFPLGVFAIALATAIFPALADNALEDDRAKFRKALRRGIEVTLWEGFAASVGLMLVAKPAVQVLFEHGKFTAEDTKWVALSVQFFSIAIWAFSLQQIVSRAYYALHDTWTPLVMSIVTLAVNLVVELPLVWTRLGEAGMAAGTAASFSVQAVLMLWILKRKVGGLGLEGMWKFVLKLLVATVLMSAACLLIQKASFYPADLSKATALKRLLMLVGCGGAVYIAACSAMGIGIFEHMLPSKAARAASQINEARRHAGT